MRKAYHESDRRRVNTWRSPVCSAGCRWPMPSWARCMASRGALGGMFDAPHGAICARLLPLVMEMNIRALMERDRDSLVLPRYADIARVVSGDYLEFNGAVWAAELAKELEIPGLAQYGVTPAHIPEIVQKSKYASSMKGI